MLKLEDKVKKGFITLTAAIMLSPVADTLIPIQSQNPPGLFAQSKTSSFFEEYSKKKDNKVNAQKPIQKKAYALQPVDFDVLDQNGYVYESYRNVTSKQAKDLSITIPEGGRIRVVDPQKVDKYIEDIMMYDETGKKLFDNNGKSAFKDEASTKRLGLKAGNRGHMTFNLEFGLDIPSSFEIPYEITPATPEPEPEPQPKPRSRQRELAPPSEPVEEQSGPPSVIVSPGVPYQVPYQVVRPVGFFQMFFGFPRVRYAPYPMFMGGSMPYYQPCYPNNFYGPNRQNFRQFRQNYCPPNRSNIHRASPVRASPIRISNLRQNIRSSPVRRR